MMSYKLIEALAFLYVVGAASLVAGLLRTAKAASEAAKRSQVSSAGLVHAGRKMSAKARASARLLPIRTGV